MEIDVLVLTYNHEKYIRRCLDSVLAQKVRAKVNVIVGCDLGTDSTLDIIKSYGDKVKCLVLPKQKKISLCGPNGRGNFINILNVSKADYIAFIEGDDYWLTDKKLQLQLDYIDQTKCDLVADYIGLDEKKNQKLGLIPSWKMVFIPSSSLITSSFLFRREVLVRFGRIAKIAPVGDLYWQLLTRNGVYLTESTTHYETGNVGSWTNTRVDDIAYWRCYYRAHYKASFIMLTSELSLRWLYLIFLKIKEQIQNKRLL